QLIYAGKLSNAKGVPWLLRALSGINSLSWKLHLVGSGSGIEKEECLKLAGDLENRVKIYGSVSQVKLAELMKQAHIFILPSFYEGLPLVVMEALACGCRIVATDLPGIKELLGSHKLGHISLVKTPRLHSIDQPFREDYSLFENQLKQVLEKQIDLTLKSPDFEYSRLKQILREYYWENIFRKVEEVYYSVVED
ncbi:MAG: glycosyltransferase, partial [Calditrichia bacterium]|nr:glycosyltransferase [Calditrichia bacterium]